MTGQPTSPRDQPRSIPQRRVLLAEDSATLRRLILTMLQRYGFELLTATNGREAVDNVQAASAAGRPVDLILMDVNMPEMSGYDATWTLRRDGYAGRIVILTAIEEEYDMARNLCNGADDFLAKPFSPEQLDGVIRGLIDMPSIHGHDAEASEVASTSPSA